jgi:hypothetical protein
MIIIYLNEMRNISMFIFNFNYIKDFSKIIMEQKCNNIYCEAETDRYNIAKNSYKLLLPNDIFNSKTYIIFVFILSILIYIYYYYILIRDIFELNHNEKYNVKYGAQITLHIGLFAIILGMIIARYVPTEEIGYLNYFKNTNHGAFISVGIIIGILLLMLLYFSIKSDDKHYTTNIIIPCFMLSFILLLNLLNMVLTFRNNTTPILITKDLLLSLNNSLKYVLQQETTDTMVALADTAKAVVADTKVVVAPLNLETEITIITELKGKLEKSDIRKNTKENIQYVLNILNAYSELLKIKSKKLSNFNDTNNIYIEKLKNIIKINNAKFNDTNSDDKISDISLIYDKEVKIPNNYSDNDTNSNSYNDEYKYTADISYDNPNLFYEKYWGMNVGIPQFLLDYSYFTPRIFFGDKPNLYKILILVIVFIIVTIFAASISKYLEYSELYNILLPLITFAILIIYIIIFICFNTWFNKYVVYKCLDCSYKRSLNKLNNIVTPYIRLYDNKIIKGNKNYTHHYIISNVFYSILCGYIKLNNDITTSTTPINEKSEDNKKYHDLLKIKSNRLKFASMNSNILNNDNEFREYYKAKFNENVYNSNYTDEHAKLVYGVFPHIFNAKDNSAIKDEESINTYFTNIISKDNIKKIFKIIKKCLILFEENKFNYNLIYYNNFEKNNDDIDKFKFYKDNDNNKIIPYKFILKLDTYKDFEKFIELPADENTEIDKIIDKIDVKNVLNDNNDISQASDMEKEQDNYLIKIIAKYLLILGHINANKNQYNAESTKEKKKEIYEKKTYHLYYLFSKTLYQDTYEINDTFNYIDKNLIITTENHRNLTYIYNFLETKYVSISSNDNNNYLANIIKSINNKINNDDKTFINTKKSAQYLFRENINEMDTPFEYNDDQEILNVANNVSTIDFGCAYGFNMLILILYYYIILKKY